MFSLVNWVANTFSFKDKQLLIQKMMANQKHPEEKAALASAALAGLPDLEKYLAAHNIFQGLTPERKRELLEDILKIAVAGGLVYASGGTNVAAEMAAAKALLDIINKPQK